MKESEGKRLGEKGYLPKLARTRKEHFEDQGCAVLILLLLLPLLGLLLSLFLSLIIDFS